MTALNLTKKRKATIQMHNTIVEGSNIVKSIPITSEDQLSYIGFKKYINHDYDYEKYIHRDPGLSENAICVLKSRYMLARYNPITDSIDKENSYYELCKRVSRILASAETLYIPKNGPIDWIHQVEFNIFVDMFERRFLFNSPALFNIGIEMVKDKTLSKLIYDTDEISWDEYKLIFDSISDRQMCFACFVVPVEDSIVSIFNAVKNAALITKAGGGVGISLSKTREKSAPIKGGVGGVSSGSISWLEQFNIMGASLVQGGVRRSAFLSELRIDHPDILDYIECKDKDGHLSFFNISVGITDEFMEAVKHGGDFTLKSRIDSSRDITMKAEDLWNKICTHAWKNGDPGLLFIDKINDSNLLKADGTWPIETTNPCFTGDTLIYIADDNSDKGYLLTFNELAKESSNSYKFNKSMINAYCMDDDNNIVKRNIKGFRVTSYIAKVCRITFNNGMSLTVTPAHRFILTDGTFKEAKSLTPLDKLRYTSPNSKYTDSLFVTNIEYLDKPEVVYNGVVEKYHNYFVTDKIDSDVYINVCNCGEEPLPFHIKKGAESDSEGGSSCNLGSINLIQFIDENGNFNFEEFSNQICRSSYYLDLVIDATKYPLKGIEENTLLSRPIGLGIMGLADAALLMNMEFITEYDSVFSQFCNNIGEYLSLYSMEASINIAKFKNPFPEHKLVSKLIEQFNDKHFKGKLFTDDCSIDDCYKFLINNTNSDNKTSLRSDKILPSDIIRILISAYNQNEDREFFKYILSALAEGMIRNSRRLSIAPTGTLSILCDVSSGIEPNYAFSWKRTVAIPNGVETTQKIIEYIHPILAKNEKVYNEFKSTGKITCPVWKTALDISYKNHIGVVDIFAQYIDAAISKTVNMAKETTIDDVKTAYMMAYDGNCKGITVYRDGSRDSQPITITDPKDKEPSKDHHHNICTVPDESIRNPEYGVGAFLQTKTPFGTMYVSGKFNMNDELREVFITLNKSGQELKAISEMSSRLISIALQEAYNHNTVYRRILKTLKMIAGFEAWVYTDLVTGNDIVVKSIPDVLAHIIPNLEYIYLKEKYGREAALNMQKLNRIITEDIDSNSVMIEQPEIKEEVQKYNAYKGNICPQCGSSSFIKSGSCDRCFVCGHSKCSA